MYDPNAVPTAEDVEDIVTRFLVAHELQEGEAVNLNINLSEVVRYYDDGRPPTYRRVRIAGHTTHPGALESLVRHTAEDLNAEQHPTPDANSGRMRIQRHG